MNNFLKILLLSIFAFVAFPSLAQPPGTPPDHGTVGVLPSDQPIFPYQDALIWTVTNHTDCDVEMYLYLSLANDNHEVNGSATIEYPRFAANSSEELDFTTLFQNSSYSYISNASLAFVIYGNTRYVYPNGDGQST